MVRIQDMTREQLLEAVQAYPWFAAARAQLCMAVALESGTEASEGLFRDSLPYVPDPSFLSLRLHDLEPRNYSDADLKAAIREVIASHPKVVMAGMDYFSREDYDMERSQEDMEISRMAMVDYSAPAPAENRHGQETFDLVSETLAQIYAQQNHPERAIEIYKQLSLQSPEKSAYFASLIDNLNS